MPSQPLQNPPPSCHPKAVTCEGWNKKRAEFLRTCEYWEVTLGGREGVSPTTCWTRKVLVMGFNGGGGRQ